MQGSTGSIVVVTLKGGATNVTGVRLGRAPG